MEENKGAARYTAKDIVSFLIGCIGPYGTVIGYLFVKTLISYGEPFNFQDVVINQFLIETVPSVLIYGSYFIIPGCLIGEWVYRKFAYRLNYFLSLLIFACVGLIYAVLLSLPGYLSDGTVDIFSVLFLLPIIGAVLFFIFRRKA
ncbi:hypothetical protein QUF79_20445 [Fictibacillus enclensis]|uniref:hypothetical protein n=1 Tax=Fictibacillus enclensis TaxID=1017270 RepID=UPI0025A10CF1|nr:hypothetical protein [Fictibacillus enclensis]MDM5200389.1 hypothetical protein [Fictibacillus enclensis]